MEDLPKMTETILVVLHFTQERLVASALVFSMSPISSFSQRIEPPSTLFLSLRSSSLISQIPLHFGQPSKSMEKMEYTHRFWPHVGQVSEVFCFWTASLMGGTSMVKSVWELGFWIRLYQYGTWTSLTKSEKPWPWAGMILATVGILFSIWSTTGMSSSWMSSARMLSIRLSS